ncbi:hypothetical protein NPIL_601531 [Nephila pilipes]|uniref:Uncharacterized protein n=1 Tax=Nephila pilipes TaxID=299642 RepID=A0A8X6T0X7_NEPPI|nr:hypothetical protein NPIL_335851 [Nephila pilipes]GFT46256.1 hypothetical protein NPIL_281991 [Nephila pilipes]GFT57083.1 hypothetical protein NPIL_537451 [Nephila pilipes]GFU52791.1 hypothetical protein NPIL_601531 [Nephila pilipes]
MKLISSYLTPIILQTNSSTKLNVPHTLEEKQQSSSKIENCMRSIQVYGSVNEKYRNHNINTKRYASDNGHCLQTSRNFIEDNEHATIFRNKSIRFVVGDESRHITWFSFSTRKLQRQVLYYYKQNHEYSVHALTKPTRISHHAGDFIMNICLAKGLHSILASSISELSNDHYPKTFDVSLDTFYLQHLQISPISINYLKQSYPVYKR